MSTRISHEYFLRRIIVDSPDLETVKTRLVAGWLEALAEGTEIGVYGCGTLTRNLVDEHHTVFAGLEASFFNTHWGGEGDFMGHPMKRLEDIVSQPPEHIILMSKAYEEDMLENLEGIEGCQVHTLMDMVNEVVGPEDIQAVQSSLNLETGRVAGEIGAILEAADKTIFFVHSNLPPYFAQAFGHFRENGYAVILFTCETSSPPLPTSKLVERGCVDYVYGADSSEKMYLVARECSCLELCPDIVFADINLAGMVALQSIVNDSNAKTAFYPDFYFHSILGDNEAEDMVSRTFGYTPEILAEGTNTVFCKSDILFLKDDPDSLPESCAKGDSVGRVYPFFSFMGEDDIPQGMPERQADSPRFRIAYGQTMHSSGYQRLYVDRNDFLETVEIITGQGIEFCLFNASDKGHGGFDHLLELAASNPLFQYSPALPWKEFIAECSSCDLGLLHFPASLYTKRQEYFMSNTQLKLFAYAQAGLPILAFQELRFCHDYVLERAVGMGISYAELGTLAKRMEEFDFMKCRENLFSVCSEYDVKRQVKRMCDCFEHVLSQ